MLLIPFVVTGLTLSFATGNETAQEEEFLEVGIPEPSAGSMAPSISVSDVSDELAPDVRSDSGTLAPPIDPDPLAPPLSSTIEGINFDENASHTGFYQIPPDPIGAAGPGHLVSVVNSSIEWHTKAGVQQNSQSLASFFSTLSPVNLTFDPKVIYDQYNGRFVVVTLERRDTAQGDAVNSSRILVAVSDDSDPNGTWRFLAIDSKINIGGVDRWADYPGLAVDEEAIYITNNMFSFGAIPAFAGVRLWIVNKTPLYSGGAGTFTVHDPYSGGGIATTTQPAHMFGTGPATVGTFLVSYDGLTSSGVEFVQIVRVDNPLTAPSFSQQFVSVGDIDNTAAAMPDAPQMGTATLIESNDRRALNAVWRNGALWMTAQIVPGSGSDTGQATAHWWKLNTTSLATITVSDQGNVGGEDIAAGTYTFMPSIAVDAAGNMGIGFAASASSIFPGAYFTARLASDPAGTVQPSGTLAAGLDYYIRTFGGSRNRWGDYSGISIDPSNDATFCVFNEYAITRGTAFGGEDGRWGNRWGCFSFCSTEVCNGIDDDCDGLIDEGVQTTFYRDADNDTFGNPSVTTNACAAPAGYVSNNTDCNDSDASIHPGATEVCNGLDDDCDTLIDEGVQQTFYRDADNDTYGNPSVTTNACAAPTGYVSDNTDCNDANSAVHPGATEVCNGIDDDCDSQIDEGVQTTFYRDADNDTFGNPSVTTNACAAPGGYVSNNTDCNDSNANIHPGATEVCNGLDDDCDGLIDEGVQTTFYRDADNDTFGNPSVTTNACAAPSGYVSNNTDCDDGNANVNPGATEVCNGIDDDCDGQTDEGLSQTFYRDADGDTYGNASATTNACAAPSGYVSDNTDCDDGNANVNPAAVELCNGIDDDCDNQIDEGAIPVTFYQDADGDTFGNPNVTTDACTAPPGYVADNTDCDDTDANIHPGASERCNGLDDDCNSSVPPNEADADGDNYRVCDADCNDGNAAVNPGATEVCNGIDDDCDGLIDEGLLQTFYRDADGDTYGNASVTTNACAAPAGYVSDNTDCDDGNANVNPGATEVCNGIDDDCDGELDEESADLSVSKSANRKSVKRGQTLIYTTVVSNNGPATANNVILMDNLPSGVSFVSASPGGCVPSGSTLTCNLGSLASGSSVTVTITVTVTASGQSTLVNEACVSSSTPDCDSGNDCGDATTRVVGRR